MLAKKRPSFLRRNGIALVLAAGIFALTFAVVYRFRAGDSDYIDHAVWALAMTPQAMLRSLLNGQERLWHILVKLCFDVIRDLWVSAALVTAAANAAAYFLVFRCLESAFPGARPRWPLAALTASAFLVSALALPGGPLVASQGYVNSWHNPTNIMVRPFAAAVFYMTLRIYNRRRCGEHAALVPAEAGGAPFAFDGGFGRQFRAPVFASPAELVLYPLCLLLSVYAKPSFLQYFAPAVFLLLLADVIRTRGMLLPFCLKLALAYLPAVLVIGAQFFRYFGGFSSPADAGAAAGEAAGAVNSVYAGSGAAFYFIRTSFTGPGQLLADVGRALLMTLCGCAFPLAVLWIDGGYTRRSAAGRLSLLGAAAARLEALCLHELGERASHGNFTWAYSLSLWLLWTVALGRFAEKAPGRGRTARLLRYIAGPLLLWHLAAGVVYVLRILRTGLYLY